MRSLFALVMFIVAGVIIYFTIVVEPIWAKVLLAIFLVVFVFVGCEGEKALSKKKKDGE